MQREQFLDFWGTRPPGQIRAGVLTLAIFTLVVLAGYFLKRWWEK